METSALNELWSDFIRKIDEQSEYAIISTTIRGWREHSALLEKKRESAKSVSRN